MRTEAEKLLYRAVIELSYVQAVGRDHPDLAATSEGREIVAASLKLLAVTNLMADELPESA